MTENKQKPSGYWTLERCKESALKYNSKMEWKSGDKSAYQTSVKNKWLDECCVHMVTKTKPSGYWNLERCKEDALKYSSKSEWCSNSGSAYASALKNGWVDECCVHMVTKTKPSGYWTLERCKEDALKYKTRKDWAVNSVSGYLIAHKNNWILECCRHMECGFLKSIKLDLINQLEYSDLLTMDPFEIYTIIGQGKLPVEFGTLTNTDAGSEERIITLRELREQFEQESDEESDEELDDITTQINDTATPEIIVVDDVDDEITGDIHDEPRLPVMNLTGDLHSLDNSLYASMDEEAFESLVQYKLRKLWNNVLNNEISLEDLTSQTGGKYFTMVRDMFLEEYEEANNYTPAIGYSFKFQPNLMQKLTVQRLLKN